MAVRLLSYEVADLCLGKPPLRPLSISATVGEALSALRVSDDNFVSVWSCDHSPGQQKIVAHLECLCVGKICMVDIICYLCKDGNLLSPSAALDSPVSLLLSEKVPGQVRHVEPSSSLLEVIGLVLQGAQNLVVPIKTNSRRKLQKSLTSSTAHNGREFCWLTQEDVIRFLLSSIGLFSPILGDSIKELDIISTEFLAVKYHSPASSALGAISHALAEQTSVAVVDDNGIFIGEISPFTLTCCDETVAAAVSTLSSGELMAYIDCGGPPEDLVRVVQARLKERNLEGMLEEFVFSSGTPSNFSSSSSSSSDDELLLPLTPLPRSGRFTKSSSYSARMVRWAEAIVCHRRSSLVAVMIQAIAHRVNYVWVIDEDCRLAGIVTFTNMLEVFYEHLQSTA